MSKSADEKHVIWTEGETRWFSQDCACASARFTPDSAGVGDRLPISMQRTRWEADHDALFTAIGQGYTLAYASTGGQVSLLSDSARVCLDTYRQPRRLDAGIARTLVSRGLLKPSAERRAPPMARSTTLTAWLHVTSACNLGCTYCYVRPSSHTLSPAMGESAIAGLFASAQRHGMDTVKIKYAGGEPALRFDLVGNLHDHARGLADAAGLDLQEVLLTNGTLLTEEHLHWAKAENVALMISLDGVGEVHDRIRCTREGNPTFNHIVPVIDAALRLGLRLYLSTTVSALNVEGLADVVAFTMDRGLLPHLNLVRTLNPALMPPSPILIQELGRALEVIQGRLPFETPLVGGFFDLATFTPHSRPCGAGQSYVAIGLEGGLHSCQTTMGQSAGSVEGSKDFVDVIRASDLAQVPFVEDLDECRTCPWRRVCAGGCPLMRRAYGRSPYCEVYQAILPELLRLEGMRILALTETPG